MGAAKAAAAVAAEEAAAEEAFANAKRAEKKRKKAEQRASQEAIQCAEPSVPCTPDTSCRLAVHSGTKEWRADCSELSHFDMQLEYYKDGGWRAGSGPDSWANDLGRDDRPRVFSIPLQVELIGELE